MTTHAISHRKILKNYLEYDTVVKKEKPVREENVTYLYNNLLLTWTPQNNTKTLSELKRLWNGDKEFLPLMASSKSYPICTYASIILAEFIQMESTTELSCLWNFFVDVMAYSVLETKEINPMFKLFRMLTYEYHSSDIWLHTLWPTVYKLPEEEVPWPCSFYKLSNCEEEVRDFDTCCDIKSGKCFLRHK